MSKGTGSVDESLLTGESRPIAKHPGDLVLGGSVLTDGSLDIQVTRAPNATAAETDSDSGTPAGSTLHQIAALVQESLHRKTRSEETADRISRIFVPLVLTLAAVSGLTVYFAFPGHHNFAAAFTRAVAVLVIACPCALGIATPMALLAAVAAAARRGILVSDPESLLAAARLKSVIFDKTGTLTEGRFQVQTVQPDQLQPRRIRRPGAPSRAHPSPEPFKPTRTLLIFPPQLTLSQPSPISNESKV